MIKVFLSALLTIGLLSGCVQSPTTTSSTVDNSPQIMFRATDSELVQDYTFKVDGLDMGKVGPYTSGTKALRLLSGTHTLEVFDNAGQPVLKEKVYLGDGATKTVVIPK